MRVKDFSNCLKAGFVFFLFSFAGCLSSKGAGFPYLFTFLDFSEDERELAFTIRNLSDKEIKAFSLVLSVFDGDGEPVLFSEQVPFSFYKSILPEEEFSGRIDFSEYLDSENADFLMVDYFYAEKIEFQDGSVWEDPLGRFSGFF